MLNKKTWSMALAALCLVLLTGLTSFAQQPDRGKDRMEKLKAELNLSEEQATQMEALHQRFREQKRAFRDSDTRPSPEERKAMREAHKAELTKILSPEQMQQWEEMRQEHGGKMHMKGHPGIGHGPHAKLDKESKKELHKLLRQQRVKLEASLSAADKAKIDELRGELKALKPELKAQKKAMKSVKEQGEKPSEEMRAEMKPLREQKRAIMKEAGLIAQRYEAEIKNLHEEIKPDLERILGPEVDGCRKGGEAEQCKKKKGAEHHRQKMAARFILMNPNKRKGEATAAEVPEMEIYPNPSRSSNTLSYQVKSAGNVRVDLISKDGQVLKTVFQGNQEAGFHELPVDIGNLGTDVYYYKVSSADGVVTKRFTVAR